MKPLSRHSPNKRASTRKFNRSAATTKAMNTQQPMRGGWRL